MASALVIVAAAASLALGADRAGAYVYWSSMGGFGEGEIGRARLDGSHIDRDFVRGAIGPAAIEVSRHHVFWSNNDANAIGRARLDGSKPEQLFIRNAGFANDLVVAGDYVYWTRTGMGRGTIARARLDGSEVERRFIRLPAFFDSPGELDVHDGYIYWTNLYPRYTIGRVALDGSGLDPQFIRGGLKNPVGITVTDEHVIFTNHKPNAIARADLDGGNLDKEFIPDIGTPSSLASDRRFLYWTGGLGPVVRARLDGSHVKPLIRRGRIRADSVAVDGRGPR